MDSDADDPWGEEPSWARNDDATGSEQRDSTDTAENEAVFGAQHVLILIDCRPSMFEPCIQKENSQNSNSNSNSNSTNLISPFDAAIMACEKLLRLRVHYVATSKSGKRDGVGIILYGTKQKPILLANIEPSLKETDSDNEHGNDDGDDSEDSETDEEDEQDSFVPAASSSTHILVPLVPPGIKEIKAIRECLPDELRGTPSNRDLRAEYADDENVKPSTLAQRMGQTTLCPLRSALHEASKTFVNAKCVNKKAATSKYPGDSKTVWIFTNEDDPCRGGEEEAKLVVMVATDAVGNGIDIQVWPLPRTRTLNRPFQRDVFFHRIVTKKDVYADQDFRVSRESMNTGVFDFEDMLEDIQRQWKKVRKVYSVPLLLPNWSDHPDDPGIQLDFFHIVRIQTRPTAVTIHQLTKKQTIRTSQYITKDTAEVIQGPRGREPERNAIQTSEANEMVGLSGECTDRIRTFVEFGGERVLITKKELNLVKSVSNATDKPSLILIGFKPLNAIPLTHRISRSYIGYPNDKIVRGSRIAFANLHAAMIRKGVLAVGELLVRATATSRLVALYPQQERREMVGEGDAAVERQVTPPGMIIVDLPYEDDIRAVGVEMGPVASEELVERASQLIRNQQLEEIELGFDFQNFALAKFSSFLEAVALEIPEQEVQNQTEVDEDAVREVAGEEIERFRLSLPEDVNVEKLRKRKVLVEVGSEVDWVSLYKADTLSKCNVDTLKHYLRSVGGRVNGRKRELILRVTQHIENELFNTNSDKPST